MSRASWLLPDGVDRARMLEMDRQLQPVRRVAFGILALTLVASGPWLGWWTVIPLALAAVIFRVADTYVDRVRRPEYALFASWAASQAIIAVSVAMTGGPHVATMSWFAIPIITLGARFSDRGMAVGLAFTLALLLGVAFGVDTGAVLRDPPVVFIPVGLIVAVAMFQTVLMRSDVRHRTESIIDPLTGMFNRKALDHRVEELTAQSRITSRPIGLIFGDIDHFKAVNDAHGHAAGDSVLESVAGKLRSTLRAYDLFYRVGGEEFLVLLPGADRETASGLAESLRSAVAGELHGGHRVTMSFGTAASGAASVFDYPAVFAQADAALYEAKRAGRDRVCPPARGKRVTAVA